ncbi:MAG TPA: hypothetical protein P5287_04450 [bacterium]|nr:hypothetical protein [bacterium]
MRAFARGYVVFVVCSALAAAGCSMPNFSLKKENEIYPKLMRPDAPLVLAIPGLNIPGEPIRQRSHFGNLVQMLADRGIPCKELVYDADDYPLTAVANLGYDQTSIGQTRVSPMIVDAVQEENDRRKELGVPPVKEVVLFTFSQGSVIGSRIIAKVHRFKREYEDFSRRFGQEWIALKNDPEFLFLMGYLNDYIAVRDIKVQREKDFKRDPDLRNLYKRTEKKLKDQSGDFSQYIADPSKKYPQVQLFEPPETPKYPKRYPMISEYQRKCNADASCRDRLLDFFVSYAEFKDLLDIHIRFISTAGSFFGSPNANTGVMLAELFVPAQLFLGREYNQIRDTQLGSEQQLITARSLYIDQREGRYPFMGGDTLFILGANGDKGDGIVDQSCAHLADHIGVHVSRKAGAKENVEIQRLPDFPVVPLEMTHLPRPAFPIGFTMGASYMVEGNPVFDYLLEFIDKDWRTIDRKLDASGIRLRQFMVVVCPAHPELKKKISIKRGNPPRGARINRQFLNRDTGAVIWTGTFTEGNTAMNLTGKEEEKWSMSLELAPDGREPVTVTIPISPGCNTFVGVDIE